MKSFEEIFRRARQTDDYWVADAIHTFTEELYRLVDEKGISRTELARRLGTSKAYVTKIFKGNANFTVETMVKLTRAAEGRLHIHVAAKDHGVAWFDFPKRATWGSGEFTSRYLASNVPTTERTGNEVANLVA